MVYQVGDSPAEPLRVSSYSVDLTQYNQALAVLLAPDESMTMMPAAIEGDEVVVEFLDLSAPATRSVEFDIPGIWSLAVTVSGDDSFIIQQRSLPIIRFVVEALPIGGDVWHTVSSAREADWPDAREMSDMTLYELLETAKHDVIEFAPVLAEGQPIPPSYRMAQLAHARNRWNAALADPGTGDIGGEGFAIPARPLDWQIKQLLRPSRGIPAGF